MNKQFRVALFDLDGTLINTEDQYTIFWERVGEELNINVPNLSQVIKGRTLTSIFNNFIPSVELQQEISRRLDLYESQMQFPFYPGVLEFIQDIRKNGVRCAVVTSSNQAKMSVVKRNIPGFDKFFDKVLTAEDFSASKPDPACYLLGAQVFSAHKSECVVFEDVITLRVIFFIFPFLTLKDYLLIIGRRRFSGTVSVLPDIQIRIVLSNL